jgi:hypothetical protein
LRKTTLLKKVAYAANKFGKVNNLKNVKDKVHHKMDMQMENRRLELEKVENEFDDFNDEEVQ